MTEKKRKKPWAGGIGEAEPEGVQIYDREGRQLAGPTGEPGPKIRHRVQQRRRSKLRHRAA